MNYTLLENVCRNLQFLDNLHRIWVTRMGKPEPQRTRFDVRKMRQVRAG
jgi:hypothetical protein